MEEFCCQFSVKEQSIDLIATVDDKLRPGEFRNVLFVSFLNANLISIRTATDAGAEILFTSNKVVFKMHAKVIITGESSRKDLYHLNITIDNYTGLTAAKKRISLSIIHQRFSHLNCRSIKRMADKKAAGGLNFEYSEATLDQCNSCIYGKMHLTGFPKALALALEQHDQIK